jgi:hypothetical protein
MTDTVTILKASDWIEHDGKGMPVSPDTKVIVRFRDGEEEGPDQAEYAECWGMCGCGSNWSHEFPSPSDIVAYRIILPYRADHLFSKAITAAEEAGR